jgi:HK97 family phage major capsid protein
MRRANTTVIPTDMGNDLPIPTDDDTSNTGAILSENNSTGHTEQDVTVGAVVLHAYTYSSKLVKVSIELLQDSAFPIQPWLSAKLGTRIGRITNTHFTTGDASSKPQGAATGSALGVTAASATAFTADELIDLFHAVDVDYREGAQWMAHDLTVREIRQLKDGNGNYLWQPGLTAGQPDLILGKPFVVNNAVATIASAARAVLFGDFSTYYIRDVNGVVLRRLDERYAEFNQVAFLAFSRHDGALVDAGTNPIKHLVLA